MSSCHKQELVGVNIYEHSIYKILINSLKVCEYLTRVKAI